MNRMPGQHDAGIYSHPLIQSEHQDLQNRQRRFDGIHKRNTNSYPTYEYGNGYVGGSIGINRGDNMRRGGGFAIIEGFGGKASRRTTNSARDLVRDRDGRSQPSRSRSNSQDKSGRRERSSPILRNIMSFLASPSIYPFGQWIPKNSSRMVLLGVIFALFLPLLTESLFGGGLDVSSRGLFAVTNVPRNIITSVLQGTSDYLTPSGARRRRKRLKEDTSREIDEFVGPRPDFVYEHPYVSSSYYTSTKSIKTLISTEEIQVRRNVLQQQQREEDQSLQREIKTRLAIVRPFCEFDAEALPTTFTCWNALPPCKAAQDDLGDEYDDYEPYMTEYQMGDDGEFRPIRNKTIDRNNDMYHAFFDSVGSDAMKSATADVFLFYSQTFSENDVAIKAVDTIIDQFFEPGGWSQCFENIYAIEANIPQELDLYIPSAQEELYNWVNGPNRQFEAAFRIIQSGEWGEYDGFYLMEGDSVPIKAHWLDVVLSEIDVNRPFAILGAQYDGDKWDNFYEKIPISLLHHTNGNAIYNTSHPLLERLVGQLEVEAPCPYNSIPYDYRMSQMWVEGTLGIVPKLAPKIMLNEEGENITLSNNTDMFNKWAEIWEEEDPFKYTPVIHNYAATNLIPRHLGPEYIIHGAKLYSPWDPTKTEVTLVVSEWFFDRSLHLIQHLDDKDHPFSEVVVMVPPAAAAHDDYDLMTEVPVRTQHRGAPDFMDLCEADIKTDWFMITNSYHHVARHVDLMFTPGTFKPVIPFTPATYAFCFKYPYCKETINLAQRFNPGHDKVVQDMDMLYNTEMRDSFCKEWKEENGEEGENMYKNQQRRLMFRKKIIGPPGPTGTSYYAWLVREGKDGMYKLTDRSLYGARPPFVKIFAKEEKLDGMSEDELAKRVGMTLLDNSTDCNCMEFETETDCEDSGIGCIWRPLFESCHPPELIDGSAPICPTTEAPTSAPTVSMDGIFDETESPTSSPVDPEPEKDPWYVNLFKTRESEGVKENEFSAAESISTMQSYYGDANIEPILPQPNNVTSGGGQARHLQVETQDSLYETVLNAEERFDDSEIFASRTRNGDMESNSWYEADMKARSGMENFKFGTTEEREEFVKSPKDRSEEAVLTLSAKQCDSWLPTIVPRYPTTTNTWLGASLDPESRSFSAMATSRPRRLHSMFTNDVMLPTSTLSPLQETWLTTSFPINLPKYSLQLNEGGFDTGHVALNTPQSNAEGRVSNVYRAFVDYGDVHPYEGSRLSSANSFQPLRINFVTDQVNITASSISKVEALTGNILPSVAEVWASTLSVVRAVDNLFISSIDKCGEAFIPPTHSKTGVPDTDTLIYVTANGPQCYNADGIASGAMAYSSVCLFDQHMRPVSSNTVICLDQIDASFGEISDEEIIRVTEYLTLEVGKVLGLSPSLFEHFRNPETGTPWGATKKTVTCIDGVEKDMWVPNILSASMESISRGDRLLEPFFEVVSPTVRQVVRNHYDCQALNGARLERHKSSTCFGDVFDSRYHYDEDLAYIGASADMAYSLSPLTLALLEDSSWYRADFSKSTVPLFGRGAGCGFVEGVCVSKFNSVPEYSHGFFCSEFAYENFSETPRPAGCDYTHNHKADCYIPRQGGGLDERDIASSCPMRTMNIVSCFDKTNIPTLDGEAFSSNSRCFETSTPNSVCLESYCNSVDSKLDIVVNGKVYQCDYEGQEVDLGHGYTIRCPRLSVVCPHLVCPANCSGKGVCDYCQEVPHCVCDNPFDDTPGCWGGL